MNILNETYHLVHGLSKNEKGHFKRLNGSNKRDSKLIKSFDIIASQTSFDKKEMQALLNEEGIAKNVLRDLMESILKSLSLFNSANSVTFKLNLILSHVESLFSKKRFVLCQAYVEKGIKLSALSEQETYAIQFSFWKRRLEGLLAIPLDKNFETWAESDTKQLALIEDKIQLQQLGGVQTRILMAQVSSEDVISTLEKKVLNAPILKDDYEAESLENLFLHNGIKIRCLLIAGDLESALKDSITLFEKIKNQKFEDRMISNYFVLRLDIMRLQAFLKHFDEYTANRIELERLLTSPIYLDNVKKLKAVVYPSFPVIHCAYLANKGETQYLVNYYRAFIQNPEYVSTIDKLTEIEIGLLHAWSLFVAKQFSDCFQRISKLNTEFHITDYQKLNSLSKWLELMACYEMKDASLFQSKSKSLQHYLKVRTQSFEVEKSLIKHLNSSFSSPNRNALFKELVEDNKMDFRKLRMAFSFVDVNSWIMETAQEKLINNQAKQTPWSN